MSSLIGYNNLVKSGTVTSSGDTLGFEKENAQSWKTSTWWQANAAGTAYFYIDMGAAVDVDSWGFAGSDLADNVGTIKPQYSATGLWGGEEVDFDLTHTPTENLTVFKSVTSVNAQYFRFVVNSTGSASFIGNLFLGVSLSLERGMNEGFSPANLNRDRNILNNMSNTGVFLGRVLKQKGAKITIQQQLITRTWIDANWKSLADSIELYPFYFLWDSVTNTSEAAYCIAKKITYPKYSNTLYLDFSLDCMALYDV